MTFPIYPQATWRPWKYFSDATNTPSYYKDVMSEANPAIAAVQHIVAGFIWAGYNWPEIGWRGSRHFTILRSGAVEQHLRLEDGGYHAGVTDAQTLVHPPTWKLWRGLGINVNKYTIGIEYEGVPKNDSRINFTDAQLESGKQLNEWLSGVLGYPLNRDTMPPHADIDVVNRINDFDYPSERHYFYDYVLGDDMDYDKRLSDAESEIAALKKWRTHVDKYLDGLNTAQWDHKAGGARQQHNQERPK